MLTKHIPRWWIAAALALFALPALPTAARDHSFQGDWPTYHVFVDGTDSDATWLYQYGVDDFSHRDGLPDDAQASCRMYFGV